MSHRTRVGATLAVAAVTTASTLTLALPQADATPGHQAAHSSRSTQKVHTGFALRNVGFGSRVEGGMLPASSGTTSYASIGCTNKSGILHNNYAANTTLPSLGEVDGVNSRNWTTKSGTTISSMSRHSVAKAVLDLRTFGTLTIEGITSQSKAMHTPKGFASSTATDIADIVLQPPVGPAQTIAIPSLDHPVTIPGLLTLTLGHSVTSHSVNGARAAADGLDIDILPSNTRIRLAHSAATLYRGVKRGIFSGRSNATQVRALDDNVKSGPQPLSTMPCQGTYGKTRLKSVAETDLAGQLIVHAASSSERGVQTPTAARAFEQAKIASVDLGGGQLVVNGIVAQANGVRTKKGVKFDLKGSTIGSVTVNGQEYSLPDLDGLEIPGLVKVETDVVTRGASKIDVVALRLTLLDGTGAVVDLGHAFLNIRNSHR